MSKLIKIGRISKNYVTRLVKKFLADNSMILSSSIAYYFLFSIFPLMLILISVSGFILDIPEMEMNLLEFVEERIPIIYEFTETNIEMAVQNRRNVGIIGLIFLLIATTYVFDSIQYALNKIFKSDTHRPFIKQKLFGFLIILMIFTLILLSFLFTGILVYLADNIFDLLNIGGGLPNLFIQAISIAIGLGFNFLIFSLVYYFGTNRTFKFRNIYIGAIVAAVIWEISKQVFIIYLDRFAAFELTYGSVGSIISFLMWLYISSLILLLGAQINSLTLKIK